MNFWIGLLAAYSAGLLCGMILTERNRGIGKNRKDYR